MLKSPFHTAPSAAALAATAVNGILSTALGFLVYFRLIRTLGSVGTTSVGYLRPGIGILVGYVSLGTADVGNESGIIVILIGVAAINWKSGSPFWINASRKRNVLQDTVAAARATK